MTKIRLWHRVRLYWYSNDSNDAKMVTACGLRREHNECCPVSRNRHCVRAATPTGHP